jgi:hypothetical protein
MCLNGCARPVCAPSNVVCRECLDKIRAAIVAAIEREKP